MQAKKIAVAGGVALVLYFVIAQPTQSAGMIHHILGFLKSAAEALIAFVHQVFVG